MNWGLKGNGYIGTTFFFRCLYKVDVNSDLGMWLLYITILLFSILVFKLGFRKNFPFLKSVIIYVFLILDVHF